MGRYLVTVTDNIAPTSMPYHEFVLYRKERQENEKQIVILLFKTKVNANETVPDGLELHCTGKSLSALRAVVRDAVKRAEAEQAGVVFHIHEAKSVLLFNLATGGRYRKQIVYTLHSTYRNYPFHNRLFTQLASRQCGQVVCVSRTSFRYYPERLKRKLGDRACFIQNGVDTERIEKVIRGREKPENAVFTLICVARLIPLKRHRMLFEAMKGLEGIRLVLIGQGPLEEELKKEAEALKLDVVFAGAMPRDRVYEALYGADAYVSASSYEGLPIGVLEAMCCRLPCLLSDIEQHREIAEECRALRLCGDGEWAAEIAKLARAGREERRKAGEENAEDALRYFSLSAMHRQYEEIYARTEREDSRCPKA